MSSGTPKISAPARYEDWINHNLGFNPRGQRHSKALSAFMLDNLRALSPRLDADIDSGVVVSETNADVHTRIAFRNVDLVLSDPLQPGPLHQVRTAIEHKTVMTAHGKARKNRFGDIIAYVNHVHNHNLHAIAAATVIVNTSMTCLNPDEWAKGITRPQLSALTLPTPEGRGCSGDAGGPPLRERLTGQPGPPVRGERRRAAPFERPYQ